MIARLLKARRKRRAATQPRPRRLRLESLESRSLLALVADIVDVVPDPRSLPVQKIEIDFSNTTTGTVDPVNGVDINDFLLTRDGAKVDLLPSMLSPTDQNFNPVYALDLSTVTTTPATYQLTLFAAGSLIKDAANNFLSADASDTWVITDITAPTATIASVTPNPRTTAVSSVAVTFNESVTGVDLNDFHLTRDGAEVSLAGASVSGSGANYTLNNLSSLTATGGTYVVTLVALDSDITDNSGNALAKDASTSWVTDITAPTASIAPISPNPRTTPVGNVAISFNESVTGVEISDFSLTRNGASVSLTGLTVSGSGASYTLNLSTVTATVGTYVLTLNASGSNIVDSSGNVLTDNASVTWLTDTTAPTATFTAITPNTRNTAVDSEAITFSRAVTGVDTADFTLTRNGTNVTLTGVTVTGSNASYMLNNLTSLTSVAGTYVLTLNASTSGIADSNGLALASNATVTWVMDTTGPTATFGTISSLSAIPFTFNEAVTGVDISDFTLTRNGINVSLNAAVLSGSGTTYTIDLSAVVGSQGIYVLTLVAAGSGIKDSAGNALAKNASTSFAVDDSLENNDTLASAADLGRLTAPVQVGPLALFDTNDWFRFTTSAKGTAADNVTITFNNSEGNLDLELYNVSGVRLKTSTGFGNSETVSLNGLAAGTYNVRIYGKGGATNPDYTLTINAPRVPIDDIFENNDTRQTASNLGTFVSAGTISDLALLDTHDWYRFTTTATGTSANSVSINFVNSNGNLDLELYNASGTRIATSLGSSNTEKISLSGRPAGTYYIDVLGKSNAHNVNYSLAIAPPSTAAFNIQFGFDGLTASQIGTVEQAADKWQHIIVGDLPSASFIPTGSTTPVTVDDVQMDVTAFPIDDVGNIVGGSAPDVFRSGSFLPVHGDIVFDTADLAELQADGLLYSTALHEMAHVLGFGSIWTDKGLLNTTDPNNPKFTGTQATAQYNAIFGTNATGVPVDHSGIEGTADAHWDETILGNELMTGFLNVGDNPLSKITVASMADLGYTVNLNAADPYTKPSMLLAPNQSGNSSSNQALHITSPVLLDALLAKWQSMKHDIRKWAGKA